MITNTIEPDKNELLLDALRIAENHRLENNATYIASLFNNLRKEMSGEEDPKAEKGG